jgi:uncharacterized membrane-anchored protein YhcB (DUF1043 family)
MSPPPRLQAIHLDAPAAAKRDTHGMMRWLVSLAALVVVLLGSLVSYLVLSERRFTRIETVLDRVEKRLDRDEDFRRRMEKHVDVDESTWKAPGKP